MRFDQRTTLEMSCLVWTRICLGPFQTYEWNGCQCLPPQCPAPWIGGGPNQGGAFSTRTKELVTKSTIWRCHYREILSHTHSAMLHKINNCGHTNVCDVCLFAEWAIVKIPHPILTQSFSDGEWLVDEGQWMRRNAPESHLPLKYHQTEHALAVNMTV